jgi:hypothetical protein
VKLINAAANVMSVFLRTDCINMRLAGIKPARSTKFRRLIFNDWNSCLFVFIRG